MANWLFGKVVESTNQVLSMTSGSISGNSIAGAGGVSFSVSRICLFKNLSG